MKLFLQRQKNSSKIFLRNPDENERAYLLECELERPSSIKEKLKHFQFFAEKKTIKMEHFSP